MAATFTFTGCVVSLSMLQATGENIPSTGVMQRHLLCQCPTLSLPLGRSQCTGTQLGPPTSMPPASHLHCNHCRAPPHPTHSPPRQPPAPLPPSCRGTTFCSGSAFLCAETHFLCPALPFRSLCTAPLSFLALHVLSLQWHLHRKLAQLSGDTGSHNGRPASSGSGQLHSRPAGGQGGAASRAVVGTMEASSAAAGQGGGGGAASVCWKLASIQALLEVMKQAILRCCCLVSAAAHTYACCELSTLC